jgi:broad specificity phosphatase PhoE
MGELLMYLVRHALVDLDTEERIRGTQNVALNEEGEREAEELADFFRDRPIAAVYSDDLDRTYHTAMTIATEHDLKVRQDVALRSWDVGNDLEGKSIEAHKSEIRELKLQPHIIPVGGESWGSYTDRAEATFDKYVRLAWDSPWPIVLVLHGSIMQCIWRLMGQDEGHEYDSTPVDPSGVIAVYSSRHGYRTRILRAEKGANA